MNATQKQQWIEALRSRKYEQGNGTLYLNGKYCCLGVYGRCVMGKSVSELRGEGFPTDVGYHVIDGGPENPISPVERGLAELNDDGYWPSVPFEVIAGVIDQWVEPDE